MIFSSQAITIDPGFAVNNNDYLKWLCQELEVPYHIENGDSQLAYLSVKEGTPVPNVPTSAGEPWWIICGGIRSRK